MSLIDHIFGKKHEPNEATFVCYGLMQSDRPVSSYSLFASRSCKNCYLTLHHAVPFPKRGCRA